MSFFQIVSVNFSSLTNYSTEYKLPLDIECFISGPSSLMVAAYFITSILLVLPLSIIILYHGLQQWQQKPFSSLGTTNHSDYFTYHLIAIELIGVLGHFVSIFGIFYHMFEIFLVGFYFFSFAWFGELFFHVLTCVERFLAVAYPITFKNLRNARGMKMRKLIICCVWLLCFVEIGLLMEEFYNIVNLCTLIASLVFVVFCSISVLRVLIHPGPGDQRNMTKRFSRSKMRAFYTIVSILGLLVVRFAWCLAWAVLFMSKKTMNCLLMTSDLWLNLPSILVLPLLFLHRAGKLKCCIKS